MNPTICDFLLFDHSQTVYSEDLIWTKFVINEKNGTHCIRRIRAASTELYLCNDKDDGSAGRRRGFNRSLFSGKLSISVAQRATSETLNFSSPQSENGNSYLSQFRTVASIIFIDISCGAFMNEVGSGNGRIVKDDSCIHNSIHQLDDISLIGRIIKLLKGCTCPQRRR